MSVQMTSSSHPKQSVFQEESRDTLLEQCGKCHPDAALAGPLLEVKA